MGSHWVDHADRGAELIDDLKRIASLYGLAPRDDEEVEEFREHLKRYVRTFLEGTATVQGVLRVVAESLALRIADEHTAIDAWWTRPTDELTTVEPRPDNAAALLFGVETAFVRGEQARPARVGGGVRLGLGVELGVARSLRLKVDALPTVEVVFPPRHRAPFLAPDKIVEAINLALASPVASIEDGALVLTSPTVGPSSRLEVRDATGDAAPRLLALPPRLYRGSEPDRARVIGTVDLSGGVDLSERRYLRLLVDGVRLAEVDCAGETPAATTIGEVVKRINDALGVGVASDEDGYLQLASPTVGFTSTIQFQRAAAQDARQLLFGEVASFHAGHDALPAEAVGVRDLRLGADLSRRSLVRLRLDDSPPVTIDCAGESENPGNATLGEIVRTLNEVLGPAAASHDGHFVHVVSPTAGIDSVVVFEPLPPEQDAADIVFGVVPRAFTGTAARRARLTGRPDLSGGASIGSLNVIRVALDGGPPSEVHIRGKAAGATSLDEMVESINDTLGPDVASHDDLHLILASPTRGTASSVALEPLLSTRRRRFVTRAFTTDEASQKLLGPFAAEARGRDATRARVTGKVDLTRGVDLRDARFMRLAVDGRPAIDIDCRGVRPRATMLDEVIARINEQFVFAEPKNFKLATEDVDGTHLALTSPTTGADSRIAFEPPRAEDASALLLGLEPGVARGEAATGVVFTGTADLAAGLDLDTDAFVRISIDGGPFRDICCCCAAPPPTPPTPAPSSDQPPLDHGDHDHFSVKDTDDAPAPTDDKETVSLKGPTSAPKHAGHSHDELAQPAPPAAPAPAPAPEDDHTHAPGEPPHTEPDKDAHTDAPAPTGGGAQPPASGGGGSHDHGDSHFFDPGGGGEHRTTLTDIVVAINVAFGRFVAKKSDDGRHIVLSSQKLGAESRIDFAVPPAGQDVTQLVFGVKAPRSYRGSAAAPARLSGVRHAAETTDLSVSRFLRISADGGRPVDIDAAARSTDPSHARVEDILRSLVEGLAAAKIPAAARLDESCMCFELASTTVGASSRIELLTYSGGDARFLLFGEDVPAETRGDEPTPATITGVPDLLRPVNLSERRTLKLAVDGGHPVDVDVAGFTPEQTMLGEIISHLNAVFPGLASATPDDRLVLTSPTRGWESSLRLLPTRSLELVEFPARPMVFPADDVPALGVRHGSRWFVNNEGAADANLVVEIYAPQGAVGPELVNTTARQRVRLLEVLRPGEAARLWRAPEGGLRAVVVAADGGERPVLPSRILAGPLGNRVRVPFVGEWALADTDATSPAALQLNNLQAPLAVTLTARTRGGPAGTVNATVTETSLSKLEHGAHHKGAAGAEETPASPLDLVGRVRRGAKGFTLVNHHERVKAELRAGAHVSLQEHVGRVVKIGGTSHPAAAEGVPPLVVVESIDELFDVTLRLARSGGQAAETRDAATPNAARHAGESHGGQESQGGAQTGATGGGPSSDETTTGVAPVVAPVIAPSDGGAHEDADEDAPELEEIYTAVTIGADGAATDSLVWQLNRGTSTRVPSRLVRAEEHAKEDALVLTRGRTRWTYLDCFGARLDRTDFRETAAPARFAGGSCTNRAVFDISRFVRHPLEPEAAVFSGAVGEAEPPVEIRFRWEQHQPGAFLVNLPADLPERFGSRFAMPEGVKPRPTYPEARFGQSPQSDEFFDGVVTEPQTDPSYILKRINAGPPNYNKNPDPDSNLVKGVPGNTGSVLVSARHVPRVPLGFRAVDVPFRKPRRLTLGNEDEPARLYLREKDVPGFIEISARRPGAWGNAISISARKTGPARFDFAASYRGAVFESARHIALGGTELPASTQDLLRAGPAGVLQAKAAGVEAEVTRDRAQPER
ncbi:MAG: hypothetical protein ABW250_04770 [Pyrinomonadaceae bacterium]